MESPSWIMVSVLVVMAVVGLAIIVGALLNFRKARQTKTWPQVAGKVLTVKVEESEGSEGGTVHSPKVLYEYEADGAMYESDTIAFGSVSGDSRRSVLRALRGYRVLQEVAVYYNPADHSDSVLEPGASPRTSLMTFFMIIFGLFLGGIPLIILFRTALN